MNEAFVVYKLHCLFHFCNPELPKLVTCALESVIYNGCIFTSPRLQLSCSSVLLLEAMKTLY